MAYDALNVTVVSRFVVLCAVGPVDSCPSDGLGNDMTWNFMDYTDDACMDTFTTGQFSRVQSEWNAFRKDEPCYVNCDNWGEARATVTVSGSYSGQGKSCINLSSIGLSGVLLKIECEINVVTVGDSWASDFFVTVYDTATGGAAWCAFLSPSELLIS